MAPENHPPIDEAWVQPALAASMSGEGFRCDVEVRNEDRSLGAHLAGELALGRRRDSLPVTEVHIEMRGTAGQSFGAFAVEGMSLVLEGQANDYVGKGLSGGTLILRPFRSLARADGSQVILGNVALYGATAGALFAAGSAGDRFAIRNSGATAVVEGIGEHGCEYMTGGIVLILGTTGRNFGAGMTGGVAYLLNPDFVAGRMYHPDVEVTALANCGAAEQASVHDLLRQHVVLTESSLGRALFEDWRGTLQHLLRVAPKAGA